MRVKLDLVIDGNELFFGTTEASARMELADLLVGFAVRLRRSNDPRQRADICDDATGATLGCYTCMILEGQ